ncbi:DUF2968 domain-containing protein [Pollutimonas bauzanensis]|uniref:DUF2968 domain-containing protein n=1 Tax=Pollutimonas bauzanensis TaxID=658167 RepID=UPI0033404574
MNSFRIKTRILFLTVASIGMAGCAITKAPETRPTVMQVEKEADGDATPVTPPVAAPAAPAIPGSTVAEVQQLIHTRQVSELRTSYNGNYGASLLFNRDTLTYYVALFQQKQFWRAVKTQDHARAERTYQEFIAETAKLAEVDLRRIRLEADYAHTEKQLAEQTDELRVLQNDVQTQRQQESLIRAQQATARQDAEQLQAQQKEAREQLRALQNQIKTLQAQQSALSSTKAKGKAR